MTVKILIVDDEPINVRLIEEILEEEKDFNCATAGSGEAALAILDEYNPDIIILDIMMPGIDGYDVCRFIKKSKRHKFAKVLMVSGKAMIKERLEGYDAGADDYIIKPFVDDELLAKLKVYSKLKQAEEIDELKTSILQLFSHETKTPLNGILLGSQLIIDTPGLPEKIVEYARLIELSGNRIHNLVKKILLLSSLKGKRPLCPGRQYLHHYLTGLSTKKQETETKNCIFEVNCTPDLVLEIDWKLFHEAFKAVTDNAVKFSRDGDCITISTRSDQSGTYIRISDNGPGISPLMTEKIFDEFYSRHMENHSKGTALSLAIAKNIMQLHGGDLHAESTPGEGADFIFRFPPSCNKEKV